MTAPTRFPTDDANEQPPSLGDMMHASPWRAPVTLALLATNILVFITMLGFGAGLWHTSNTVQLTWGANFGPATQDGQWWRLATALFLHFGVVHLALNMWALWDVGRLVEQLYGRWRFALLYLASGVFGNLLSLVLQGNRAVSGGASGAVFSLYGALLVFLWRERNHVQRHEFRWLFGAAIVFTVVTLGMGLVIPGIDNAAHVGGLVCGAVLAQLLARRPDLRAIERALAAENARLGVADAGRYPSLSAQLTLGLLSLATGSLANAASAVWNAGASVSAPLYSGGSRNAELDAARARYAQATLRYDNATARAVEEVETAALRYASAQTRRQKLANAVAFDEDTRRLALMRYQSGLADFMEVLDAQRQLFNIEADELAAREEALGHLVSLYKALGGGWEVTAPRQAAAQR